MTDTTLAAWEQNIAIRLVTAVPTLQVSDGITLADSYLSSTGGWHPDNPAAPTDLGTPASGLQDYQIVALLLTQITNSQYEFTGTVSLPVTFQLYVNLQPGLSATQVRDAVAAQARAYLTRVTAALPIKVDPSVLNYTSVATTVVGSTTQTERQTYQANISNTPVPVLSQTISQIRQKYSFDSTWNLVSVFVAPNGGTGQTIVIARKYADTTYNAFDPTETTQVIATINPDTGVVLSGSRNLL